MKLCKKILLNEFLFAHIDMLRFFYYLGWVFFIVLQHGKKIKLFCSWLIIADSVIVLFNFVCSCCGFLDHFWRRKPTFHACSCCCVAGSCFHCFFSKLHTVTNTSQKFPFWRNKYLQQKWILVNKTWFCGILNELTKFIYHRILKKGFWSTVYTVVA